MDDASANPLAPLSRFLTHKHTYTYIKQPLHPKTQTRILFDRVILGTCGTVGEAVSCSCLKGSM